MFIGPFTIAGFGKQSLLERGGDGPFGLAPRTRPTTDWATRFPFAPNNHRFIGPKYAIEGSLFWRAAVKQSGNFNL